MIPFRQSIGFRLLAISFVLLSLPLLVDAFVLLQRSYKHAIVDARSYLIEASRFRELPLEKIQPLNDALIALITTFLDLDKGLAENPSPSLNKILNQVADIGEFYDVFLLKFTKEGRFKVLGSSLPGAIGKDYTDFFKLHNLFSATQKQTGFITYVSYDEKTEKPYFIAVHPLRARGSNKLEGALAISDNISDKINHLLKPDTPAYAVNFALLLPSGVVFAATDPDLFLHSFFPLHQDYLELFGKENPELSKRLKSEPISIESKENDPFVEFNWRGKTQLGYLSKAPGTYFWLMSYASKQEIFKQPFLNFFDVYLVYVAILLLGSLVVWLLSKRLTRPIQNLSTVMQAIQLGDLQTRYQNDPLGFEFNDLGQHFNQMIDSILAHKHFAQEERIHKERFIKELLLGQEAQRSLLPKEMPFYPNVDIAETYISAAQVGGDFYDVFLKPKQPSMKLVLNIADASGKGVQACFYSLSVRNMMKTFAREKESVAQIMAATNNLFYQDTGDTGMFVTALMGIYDSKTRILEYYSCGHTPAMVYRKKGYVEVLHAPQMAFGLAKIDEQKVKSYFTELEPGDALIFYTDGITEMQNEKNQLFGEKRLIQVIEKEGFKSADELASSVVKAAQAFRGAAPQADDITLLIMKVKESAS